MLSDIIVRLLAKQAGITVVGVVERGGSVFQALDDTEPDFVIWGLDNAAGDAVSAELLRRRPDLRVLGVSADGRTSFLYELRPTPVPLGDLSVQDLVTAIRARSGSR